VTEKIPVMLGQEVTQKIGQTHAKITSVCPRGWDSKTLLLIAMADSKSLRNKPEAGFELTFLPHASVLGFTSLGHKATWEGIE
jgi:hypothetical protein